MVSARASSPPRMLLAVHSLVMGMAGEVALANHRAYAKALGYRHHTHHVAVGNETDRTKLLRKYSTILAILRETDERQVLLFVEDCVAFAEPLAAERVLCDQTIWLCEDGHQRHHGNGGLIIARGGQASIDWFEAILARCQMTSPGNWGLSRWGHRELVGQQTIAHDALLDGLYPNLLFPSFGHAMPQVKAWAVSFNPHVLPHAQDPLSNASVIAHLTQCLCAVEQPFALSEPVHEAEDLEETGLPLEGRLSRVGVVLVVRPGQDRFASIVEQNLRLYAQQQDYAFYRFDEAPGEGEVPLASLLRCADRAFGLHEQILCLFADALVHDVKKPLPGLIGQASILLARAPWGEGADTGMIALRKDANGQALLRVAREEGSSGLIGWLSDALAGPAVRLADLATIAPHTAFRDKSSFLVRYDGLAGNVRELVMREDAAALQRQGDPAPPEPSTPTSLSWLRHERLNRWIMAVVGGASLLGLLAQLR